MKLYLFIIYIYSPIRDSQWFWDIHQYIDSDDKPRYGKLVLSVRGWTLVFINYCSDMPMQTQHKHKYHGH